MKILNINNYHRVVGGSDAVFFRMAESLQRAGHDVVSYAAASDNDLPSPYASYFPQTMDTQAARPRDLVRYLHNGDAARRLNDLIEAEGPFDLAHLHIYYGQLTASILPVLKRHGIPIVQTLHEYKLACPIYTMERDGKVCENCVEGSTLNLLRHRCKGGSFVHSLVAYTEFWASRLQGDVRDVSRFICVSDFQRRIMERAGVPERKLTTMHNFVDLVDAPPPTTNGRGDYLLYFGRIEKLKGVATLVNAAKLVDIPLKIAGTGAMTSELEASIASDPYIEYLGYQTAAPLKQLLSNARAVVVPSEWYENCPMSLLEAKALGVPVIGARIGGIPELIQEGIDGFLFEPGNVDDLVRAIHQLEITDIDAMGLAARVDVEARFSSGAHLSRLLEIYAEVRKNMPK